MNIKLCRIEDKDIPLLAKWLKPEDDNKSSCNTLLSNRFIYDQRNMLYLKDR